MPRKGMCETRPRAWCTLCGKCICSPYCFVLFLLLSFLLCAPFAFPSSPLNMVRWADAGLKAVIEYTASDMTGVNVTLGGIWLNAWHCQGDLVDVVTSNPKGYTLTPYFMRINDIHTDVSWAKLFAFSFSYLEIEDIRIHGMEMFIEDRVFRLGLVVIPTPATNVNDILKSVEANPLAKWTASKIASKVYTNFKYMIRRITIEDMRVTVLTMGYPNVSVTLPLVNIDSVDMGLSENGVYLGELISKTVKAVSTEAFHQVNIKMGNSTTILADGKFKPMAAVGAILR